MYEELLWLTPNEIDLNSEVMELFVYRQSKDH